jgi:hypothetical protein
MFYVNFANLVMMGNGNHNYITHSILCREVWSTRKFTYRPEDYNPFVVYENICNYKKRKHE